MKKLFLASLLVLLTMLAVGAASAATPKFVAVPVNNPAFYLKVSVSGQGSGTITDSIGAGKIFFEGTAFGGKAMQFHYSNAISAGTAGFAIKSNKHIYVAARKLNCLENEFNMLDIANTQFAVFHAKHAKVYYKMGIGLTPTTATAIKDITVKAGEIGWHEGYNLLTTESIQYNDMKLTHAFDTCAKATNVAYTSNARIAVSHSPRTSMAVGKLNYDLTYQASRMTGTMANSYGYYQAGGNTYVHGHYKNFGYKFSISSPMIFPTAY